MLIFSTVPFKYVFQVSRCNSWWAAAGVAPETVQERPSHPKRQISVPTWAGRPPEWILQRTCGVRKEHGVKNTNVFFLIFVVCLFHIFFVFQNGAVPHDNLVLIKMRPDENGRFGFNVKVRCRLFKNNLYNNKLMSFELNQTLFHPQGGADQRMPIIVSRVAPGTPVCSCFICMSGDRCVWWNWTWTSDPSVLIYDCSLICDLWPLTGWHVHAAPERGRPGRADQRSRYLGAHSRWCGYANQSQLWGPIRRAHPACQT